MRQSTGSTFGTESSTATTAKVAAVPMPEVEEATEPGGKAARPVAPWRVTLSVGGMTCASCSSAVEGVLGALPGVLAVSVSLLSNSCTVGGRASREQQLH